MKGALTHHCSRPQYFSHQRSGSCAGCSCSFAPTQHASGRRGAPLCRASNASALTTSTALPTFMPIHPDAVRRRREAEERRAARLQEAQEAMQGGGLQWWERGTCPDNMTRILSAQHFHEAVASAPGLVVVDFFVPWCNACRRMYPAVQKIAAGNPDVTFLKVNGESDELRALCESLGITKLPTFFLYRQSELLAQFPANLTKLGLLRAEIMAHKNCQNQDGCDVPLFKKLC